MLAFLIASTLLAHDAKVTPLTPGQTFYEGPNDIHTVGRNASSTKPAKFVVFLVKDKGAPVLVPINPAAAGSASARVNKE